MMEMIDEYFTRLLGETVAKLNKYKSVGSCKEEEIQVLRNMAYNEKVKLVLRVNKMFTEAIWANRKGFSRK